MKLATYNIPPDARGKQFNLVVSPNTSWAQFGDKVLLYADDTAWEGVADRTERSGLRLQEYPAAVKREHMQIVVQNGRLFQQEHPDVPVIVDRGRILLVELEPERVRQLEEKSTTCYGIIPWQTIKLFSQCTTRPLRGGHGWIGSKI
jgi:hypothetical protein